MILQNRVAPVSEEMEVGGSGGSEAEKSTTGGTSQRNTSRSWARKFSTTLHLAPILERRKASIAASETTSRGFSPIRGPTQQQLLFMYLFFMLVLVSAEQLQWTPHMRIFNAIPYLVVCWSVLELNRLAYSQKPLSKVPLYANLVPFVLLIVASREAHVLIAQLFFSATMIIHMQSGSAKLKGGTRFHLWFYIVLYCVLYIGCIVGMNWFYTDQTGTSQSKGRALDPPIHLGQELTVVISLFLLGCGFVMLERFVEAYANSLFTHGQKIRQLAKEKRQLQAVQDLDRALKKEGKGRKVDTDSAMDKVIRMLRQISDQEDTTDEVAAEIERAIEMLTSTDLFVAQLDTIDEEPEGGDLTNFIREMGGKLATEGSEVFDEGDEETTVLEDEVATAEVKQLLGDKLDSWDYDIFRLEKETKGRPLFHMANGLVLRHGFLERFHVDEVQWKNFMREIEEGYKTNPYHNSIHAADVLQTLHYLISQGGIIKHMTPVEVFACIVGCAIHDYEHPGKNNQFLVNTKDPLALLYNDRAVLENHHLAAAFRVMMRDGTNILSGLKADEMQRFRETVISIVLATDMSQHFEIVGKYKARLSAENGLKLSDPKDRLMMLTVCGQKYGVGKGWSQIVMKASDISNPAKPPETMLRWTKRVMEEFYRQGDAEAEIGLPVSSFYDRNNPSVGKCQMGFIDYIVNPLFECMGQVVMNLEGAMESLKINRERWENEEFEIDQSHPLDEPIRAFKRTKSMQGMLALRGRTGSVSSMRSTSSRALLSGAKSKESKVEEGEDQKGEKE